MKKIKIEVCKLAERDHLKSKRQYAHVMHKAGTICVAKAIYNLPFNIKMAILTHEIGHYINTGDEDDANEAIEKYFGLRIKYMDTPWGRNLEILTPEEAIRAYKYLSGLIEVSSLKPFLPFQLPPYPRS